jgi:hypothetical protein
MSGDGKVTRAALVHGAPARPRRILVLANETCAGEPLFEALRARGGGRETEVLMVAPALTSRVRYWFSDEDRGLAEAEGRLKASLARCETAGLRVRGEVGDADPLQALDDAMRTFSPDEVVIATHQAERSNWLERGLVAQARARFDVPITHVVVDPAEERAVVQEEEADERRAPARERHRRRDLLLLVVAGIWALVGTAVSLLLFTISAPGWLVYPWVFVMDLGFKIAAMVVLWILFQGRPRADRLDF